MDAAGETPTLQRNIRDNRPKNKIARVIQPRLSVDKILDLDHTWDISTHAPVTPILRTAQLRDLWVIFTNVVLNMISLHLLVAPSPDRIGQLQNNTTSSSILARQTQNFNLHFAVTMRVPRTAYEDSYLSNRLNTDTDLYSRLSWLRTKSGTMNLITNGGILLPQ